MSKKILTFKQAREFLDDINNINSGGCGVSALALYLWLRKHNRLTKKTKILFCYRSWSYRAYDINNEYFNGGKKQATACSHAVVYHRGKYYDSEGIVDINDFGRTQEIPYDPNFFKKSFHSGSWNNCFKMKEYIPVIKENLGIDIPY